jgi:nitroimidazol reductase NimA-like FMN-containing flavoprotein (pyridoxamine 5'-phosphate oxidase superfamily)
VQRQEPGQWQSVICWGRYEELDLEKIKTLELTAIVEELAKTIAAIQRDVGILIPFSFEDGTITALAENGRKSTLFRIVVTEKTGRLYQATV